MSEVNAATDKAIFDAVNQHKISMDEVLNLFFMRGVIVSKKTDKSDLAKYYSSFFHSFQENNHLLTLLSGSGRKERLSSVNFITNISMDDVENSVSKIKEECMSQHGISIKHKIISDDKLILLASYQILNPSKNEFQQISNRDAEILLEKADNGFSIRGPSNSKVDEVKDVLKGCISSLDSASRYEEITLSNLTDPDLRNEFWSRLPHEIEEFELDTVTFASTYNPLKDEENPHYIDSASLKGQGVTSSPYMANLLNQGFNLTKLIWNAKRKEDPNSDLYIIEAQFDNVKDCSDFSYMVKGLRKKKDNDIVSDDGGYNKNKIPLSRFDEDSLNKRIEKAAANIVGSLSTQLTVGGLGHDSEQVAEAEVR